MPNEDKMVRKADGTYTVTVAGLTLDESIALLQRRKDGLTGDSVRPLDNGEVSEVHYRG